MAQQGFYRDPPNRRMAYDSDGTIGVRVLNGVATQQTQDFLTDQNGEAYVITYANGGFDTYGFNTLIFPELRDVSHSYRNLMSGTYSPGQHLSDWEVSVDTTNGVDGVWTVSNSFTAMEEGTTPNFRENMDSVSAPGVRAIRWEDSTFHAFIRPNFCQWHVYGAKSAGQTPHRIDFTDSSGNELLIDFDYGDQPRNSTRIWRASETWNQASALYMKNRSSTKQANDITVSIEVVNSSSDFNNFLELSKDNITYAASISYTQMNPAALVGPIYVRHSPTISAALGVKAARLKVTVGTWL